MDLDSCTNRGIGNPDLATQISKHTKEFAKRKDMQEDEDRTQHSYQTALIRHSRRISQTAPMSL